MTDIKIGCEAWIVRDDNVLLMKRGNGEHAGTWSLPGGHLEFLERVDEGIIRELKEELNLDVFTYDVRPIAITDDLRPQLNQHYIHITFQVAIGDQVPICNEPDKCAELGWFPVNELPEDIFPFQARVFDTLKSKKLYTNR